MPELPVVCPACDHRNPPGAKFCNSCGVPVHLHACPRCEAINDGDAGRCYKCGWSFSGANEPLPAADSAPPGSDAASAAALRECPQCAALNDAAASFCHRCEAALPDLAAEERATTLDDIERAIAERGALSPDRGGGVAVTPAGGLSDVASSTPAISLAGTPQTAEVDDSTPEGPRHYIGGLTAPADEAELARPEPDGGATRSRWRSIAGFVAMVALILVPAAAAVGYYARVDPAALERVIATVRTFVGLAPEGTDHGPAAPSTEPANASDNSSAPDASLAPHYGAGDG